mmetsp:Transcript_3321/g.9677  ORF Transcript_3321/g.9677 Transcript_3321/m.9677 type:complete len:280 (-) Transcript_3321:501-1340(-)
MVPALVHAADDERALHEACQDAGGPAPARARDGGRQGAAEGLAQPLDAARAGDALRHAAQGARRAGADGGEHPADRGGAHQGRGGEGRHGGAPRGPDPQGVEARLRRLRRKLLLQLDHGGDDVHAARGVVAGGGRDLGAQRRRPRQRVLLQPAHGPVQVVRRERQGGARRGRGALRQLPDAQGHAHVQRVPRRVLRRLLRHHPPLRLARAAPLDALHGREEGLEHRARAHREREELLRQGGGGRHLRQARGAHARGRPLPRAPVPREGARVPGRRGPLR